MAKVIQDTGIYSKVRYTAVEFIESHRGGAGLAGLGSIAQQLDEYETELKQLFPSNCFKRKPMKDIDLDGRMRIGDSWLLLPKDSTPIMERAAKALRILNRLRKAIAKNDVDRIVECGIWLGRMLEMVDITPHENNAMRGRKDRETKRAGVKITNAITSERAKVDQLAILEAAKRRRQSLGGERFIKRDAFYRLVRDNGPKKRDGRSPAWGVRKIEGALAYHKFFAKKKSPAKR